MRIIRNSILIILCLFLFIQKEAQAQIVFSIDSLNGNTGSQMAVPVRASGFTNMLSIQGTITFDPAVVSYSNVEQFGLLGMGVGNFGVTAVSSGKLTFSWFDGDLSGESLADLSVVFAIRFNFVGNAGSSSSIGFGNSPTVLEFIDDSYSPVSATFQSGTVSINGIQAGSDVSLLIDSLTASQNDVVAIPVRVLNFTDIVSLQGTIAFDPAVVSYVSVEQFGLPGMSSANFGVGQVSSGKLTFSWNDSDLSGENLADSAILFAIRCNVIGNNGAGTNFSFVNSPTPAEIVDGQLNIVNSYLQGGRLDIVNTDSTNLFSLLIDSVSAMAYTKALVPVRAQSFADILSMQGTFVFDTTILAYSSVKYFNVPDMSLANFGVSFVNDGKLTFSWFDQDLSGETFADSTQLFVLEFDVKNQVGQFGVITMGMSPTALEFIKVGYLPVIYEIDMGGVLVLDLTAFINTVSPMQTTYCAGDSIYIDYESNAPFDTSNVFSLQLSDETGSFANPLEIGSLGSVADTGVVAGYIPHGIPYGTTYRVRVVSTSIGLEGTDNMADLTIISYSDTVTAMICMGDSMLLGGSYQSVSGDYTDSYLSVEGCDSLVTTTLIVLQAYNNSVVAGVCSGDSLFLAGDWQTVPGLYSDTLLATNGCDSIVTTDLSVYDTYDSLDSVSICFGDSIYIDGAWQTSPGFYTDSLVSVYGCDSLVSLNLFIIPENTNNLSVLICEGDSLFAGGVYQFVSGTFFDTITGTNGCDSILITNLTVHTTDVISNSLMICTGDSVFLEDQWRTSSGTYADTLSGILGCDSILVTNLTVTSVIINNQTVSICADDSLFVQGNWQNITASYYDTLVADAGCDSIVVTNLTVIDYPVFYDSIQICSGDSLYLAGAWQLSSGEYTDSMLSVNSCDSVLITNLIVIENIVDSVVLEICLGDSIYLDGNYQYASGIYIDTFASATGCDSVVYSDLTVIQPVNFVQILNLCEGDSVLLEGVYQFYSGTFYDTLPGSNGCDSIVISTIVIHHPEIISKNTFICYGDSIFLGGQWQAGAGIYEDTLTNIYGCDSIVATTLTIAAEIVNIIAISICSGDSLFVQGGWQNVSSSYYDTLVAAAGCDSIIVTNLTVIDYPVFYDTLTICYGDSVFLEGSWRDTTGNYIDSLISMTGCDSIIFSNLTVNQFPLVDLGPDSTICKDEILILDAGVAESWLWSDSSFVQTLLVDSAGFGIGTDTLWVEALNGTCSSNDTIIITIDLCDNLSQTEDLSKLKVYPNPSNGLVYIEAYNRKNGMILMEISDITGKRIFSNEIINNGITTLDLSGYPTGIYYIKLAQEMQPSYYRIVLQ